MNAQSCVVVVAVIVGVFVFVDVTLLFLLLFRHCFVIFGVVVGVAAVA